MMIDEKELKNFNDQFKPGQSIYVQVGDGSFIEAYLASSAEYRGLKRMAGVEIGRNTKFGHRLIFFDISRIFHRDGDN